MKQSVLQQSRRSGSFRGISPLDSSVDGPAKSPAAVFWLVLHGLCCLVSLVLGFRFSHIVFFLVFSSSTNFYIPTTFRTSTDAAGTLPGQASSAISASNLDFSANRTSALSSRVVVGRHGILIRSWPHPNPAEVMKAHRIIATVQKEQRLQYGVKSSKTVIAITPTYVRTFQTLHLTGVMHSLMNVPGDLIWIVVEAGGTTNETASLIAKSKLNTIHIGFNKKMPLLWEDRHKMETQMRLTALRVVREKLLDGIVMFADDSNMHSLELFDEIQKVNWFGSISVGIITKSDQEFQERNYELPIQGPACNSSDQLIGWHTFDSRPFVKQSAKFIGDRAIVLPRKMEWSGFVLNSRLVWKDVEDKLEWVQVKDLDNVDNIESPLSLLVDPSVVEPLGSCGRKIMVWWLRVEARADSKFPAGWKIDPPLEVTVSAKRTPWADSSSEELESKENMIKNTEKRSTKTRSSRSKRRNKRKHESRGTEEKQVSISRQSGEN